MSLLGVFAGSFSYFFLALAYEKRTSKGRGNNLSVGPVWYHKAVLLVSLRGRRCGRGRCRSRRERRDRWKVVERPRRRCPGPVEVDLLSGVRVVRGRVELRVLVVRGRGRRCSRGHRLLVRRGRRGCRGQLLSGCGRT